jgi:hypothetical protein
MLTALREIIFPSAHLPLTQDTQGQTQLIVKENAQDSKIRRLTILNIDPHSFAFTLDYSAKPNDRKRFCFKQLSPYFHPENGQGINKGCDLVLFTPFREAWYVLVMDMKSARTHNKQIHLQLHNSELFVKYICTLMSAYYSEVNIPTLNYVKTYTTTKINKNPVFAARQRTALTPPYLAVSVRVNQRKEASVYLGKLLGQ